jgi:hypothetical protein
LESGVIASTLAYLSIPAAPFAALRLCAFQALSLSPVIQAKINAILLITKVLPSHLDLLQALAFFS